MGKVLIEEENLTNIANSIRSKTGSTDTMTPGEMSGNIETIEGVGGYFNANPTSEEMVVKSNRLDQWANLNYVLKMPDLVIPDNITTLKNLFSWWKLSIAPKVIFGENITSLEEMYNSGSTTNSNAENLVVIDTSGWNTKNVTNMKNLFGKLYSLQSIDVSNFNTDNVTDMSSMFSSCQELEELNISNFNTSNVTKMSSMFSNMQKIKKIDVSNFNTDNVTDMSSMFSSCYELEELNISNFNTSNVTNMQSMFAYGNKMTEYNLTHFNTSNVTNMGYMFSANTGYTDILTTINISSFDMSKINITNSMFSNRTSLTNLHFGTNLGKGYTGSNVNYANYKLDLSKSTLLTHDSLMSVINGLYDLNLTYDVANGGTLRTQSLVLGSTNLAKLTDEEKAIATNKGWTIS